MRTIRLGDRVRARKWPKTGIVGTVVDVRPPDCTRPDWSITVAWDDPAFDTSWFSSQGQVELLPIDFGAGTLASTGST